MSEEKITISLDDVNTAQVDAEVRRQEIANRMAAHQASVEANTKNSHRMNPQGWFRKSIVYMSIFGLIASLLGWGLGEIVEYAKENNYYSVYLNFVSALKSVKPNFKDRDFDQFYKLACENDVSFAKKTQENQYFSDDFWEKPKWKREASFEKDTSTLKILSTIWFILLSISVSLGLAIAEPAVGRNTRAAVINGVLGAVLGGIGGFIVSLFIDSFYNFLGGGSSDSGFIQQMFARGVGWSVLGLFVAIAPGIILRSWKKLALGLAGGLIGGLVGGVLFDIICGITGSAVPARCFNIIGLGLGAAVATTLLENLAKQGWLRVATGVITGKQFILYRNPTIIGSSPKSEIYLFKDPTIAAKHAAINGVGGKFILTALSGATVLLNGQPVKQQVLKHGDQIRVGNTIFLFEARVIKKGGR